MNILQIEDNYVSWSRKILSFRQLKKSLKYFYKNKKKTFKAKVNEYYIIKWNTFKWFLNSKMNINKPYR